jgi:hypothetical protein
MNSLVKLPKMPMRKYYWPENKYVSEVAYALWKLNGSKRDDPQTHEYWTQAQFLLEGRTNS